MLLRNGARFCTSVGVGDMTDAPEVRMRMHVVMPRLWSRKADAAAMSAA